MRLPIITGFRTRLEASLDRFGLALPWWVPVSLNGTATVIGGVAMAQRSALLPTGWIVLTGLLLISTALFWAITGEITPQWAKAVTLLAATAILLATPVVPDFAPMLLVVLAAEMAVTTTPAVATVVATAGIAVVAVAGVRTGLVGTSVYIVAVMFGLAAGWVLRWSIRALVAERGNQQAAREQALLAERQRIAREVHDVVAHSLSITLLHLTGARRALQQDRDVDEAVDALTAAERVGRAAMADVRRTVGLLTGSSSGTRPLPGADDIAELVESTRAAGLDVHYEQHGNLATVGASTGLGLYRIAQESLANIAKHAPAATAEVNLRIDPAGARLTVRNGLAATAVRGNGTGLPGMAARATQLGAELWTGPRGQHWVVDVLVPAAEPQVAS